MAARIGIELSAATCRIIEIDDGPAWKRDQFETRVLSFVSRPLTDPELTERLAALRGRRASVVVWTPHSNHRQVAVADASYDRMRAEARAIVGVASPDMPRLLSDIAPAAPHVAGMDRRTVLVATVPRTEVTGALRPMDEAGIKIQAVLTPASALASLARMRRRLSGPEALEAYIAIEESASTIALVRDGVLLAARTMPWGYLSQPPAHRVVRAREEIAMRLASDLSVCVASGHFGSMPLAQVCVCGGLPELRSMTVALMERLDVEVETLDSLFGLDTAHLPEPAGEFRERAAELRVAWAAAADRRPLLDLFRQRKRLAGTLAFSTAAIVAGVAAGVAVSWAWQDQWIRPVGPASSRPVGPTLRSGAEQTTRTAVLPPPLQDRRPAENAPREAAPDSTPAALPPFPVPAFPPATVFSSPPQPPLASPQSQAPPRILEPPTRHSIEPPVPPPIQRPVERQIERPVPSQAQRQVPTRAPGALPPVRPPPEPALRAEPTALPFEATLGTILFGPERRLAIIDGRIVQAGDDVRGARIVEITPTSVYLRDAQGQLRRLTAGGMGR